MSTAVPQDTERSKRRVKGEGSVFRRGDNGKWYFRLRVKVDGEIRELREEIPGVHDSADAAWRASKDIRHECLAKTARHEVRPSNIENVTCGELLTQYVEHVKKNRPRSAYDIERQVESQLRPFFGTIKVAKLTTRMLDAFIEQRQKQGRKSATIRNDLAYFRSALRLELKNTPCRILKFLISPQSLLTTLAPVSGCLARLEVASDRLRSWSDLS